ncbi:hypothetical protein PTSG_12712 [Salpingoeca rosetta]|uniref:alpha-L-rhamnosidase n=1 Tax=Salpingoeca rosetta (strain ATCC 50818 / BSB-021) TaxID=946362 RepID=F2UJF9_SALR5|nr:uncharacterized protein PTSG_12712 [Salpingoeca rosetta]EGD77258.1 hypothetical protein PTSG_12712 [Salpingoeca rosetta]|eukprot:XP_004990602.1 hypothetical protein PTSG_12712 [Salpingoeca rosetta]
MKDPLGVDVMFPRFSWTLMHSERAQAQTAWEVHVIATDANEIIWRSGKTNGTSSINVPYNGHTNLTTDTHYTWCVRYYDAQGHMSPWSANASFSTGLRSQSDWDGAQWIGGGQLLRTVAALPSNKQVVRAFAYVVGLGYYKLYVNGKRASHHELGAFTTYEKRVYYDTWDITEHVQHNSQVAFGVHLGPGWYAQSSVNVGKPTLYAKISIHYADGSEESIVSTPTRWKVSSHAVLPPIRIGENYTPCNMWESSPGTYVFDFCQNMAGFTTLRVPEGAAVQAGVNITQIHAEAVYGPPPAPIHHHYSNTAEKAVYITSGDGAAITYTPLFTYMGFRYVQLTNFPGVPDFNTLTAHFIHTDFELVGDISFSDPNLDSVQHITRAASMSNYQSIPTDCPQRERRGWLGDAQLSSETTIHNFFMAAPYTSFVSQINDAQNPNTGAVQDCVPWYGHGHEPADPAWGSAYTFLADHVYQYYEDDEIAAQHYDGLRFHLESLIAQAANDSMDGLLAFSWWGDWCPPAGCVADGHHRNSALVSSYMYLKQLAIVAKMATRLGKTKDAQRYSNLASSVGAAFNNHFYDATNKIYNETRRPAGAEELSIQTCIALADDLGLIPDEDRDQIMRNLVADVMVANNGHLNTGIVGIKQLLPTLSNAGYNDVALQIAQTPSQPGWVYMVQQGATTLWETWTGSRYDPVASWNHIMFGSQSAWYYQHLAGIQLSPGTRGYSNITFKPQVIGSRGAVCGNLSSVEASVVTPRGRIASSWACGGGVQSPLCSQVEEHDTLRLSCDSLGGGKIEAVSFASFGTPTGSCNGGFALSNCTSPQSMSVVTKACVGKERCSVLAENAVFGGDPCPNVPKQLAVQASGCNEAPPTYQHSVTVPVGSIATVIVPTFGFSSPRLTEGSAAIFKDGQYKPGVPGVDGVALHGNDLVVAVSSGTYAFTLYQR